ncbi:MAG: hypothetical protein V4850_05050 [Myxococcota bacterium]
MVWVRGVGLVTDARCYSDPTGTVIAFRDTESRLADFAMEFRVVQASAGALLGPPATRVVLQLRHRPSQSWLGVVYIPRSIAVEDVPEKGMVALAVAETRLHTSRFARREAVDPAVVRALARALAPDWHDDPLLGGGELVAEWEQIARACPEGWPGLLRGKCLP